MKFASTKTYGHEIGLSCAFRQWRAASHCRFLHGYALAFRFEFECDALDNNNWVVDFGSLKALKDQLQHHFDHKVVVAEDDPELEFLRQGEQRGVLQLVVLPGVGCEMFAKEAMSLGRAWLEDRGLARRVRLRLVEVREHGANSAIVEDR